MSANIFCVTHTAIDVKRIEKLLGCGNGCLRIGRFCAQNARGENAATLRDGQRWHPILA